MYTVYGKVFTRTIRVMWMLEEIGQPYEHVDGAPHSDPVRAVNAIGKIPVLRDGDALITDSVAILTYLADKHGALTHPAGTLARARQDAAMNAVLDELEGPLWTLARHDIHMPEALRLPGLAAAMHWEFARGLDMVAERLDGPFLAGAEMTIADIVCGHCLNWAHSAKFPVENEKMREYGKRLRGRDALKRAAARTG